MTRIVYKRCFSCERRKRRSSFFVDAQKKDGLNPSCKHCVAIRWGKKIAAAGKRWRLRNAERVREGKRRYRKAHYVPHPKPPKDPTAPIRAKANWKRRNPEYMRADRAKRRALELHAVPAWADATKLKAFYVTARRLSQETGIKHHVDHVIPLGGRTVCGLHCEENLQVISARENSRKSNKFIEEALYG